jgi:hypothetical protein
LAVRGFLSPASIDNAVVIGRDYDETVVVVFGLRSISLQIILPQHSVVDESVVGPDAKWVLLQGEYNVSLKNARIALQTDALELICLARSNVVLPARCGDLRVSKSDLTFRT